MNNSQLSYLMNASALAKTAIDDILMELSITFGPTIKIQPNPKNSGFFGMFAGLLLAGCWVVLSLFYRAIQKKIP